MRHIVPLDGIRAVAIIAVLIFHISPTPLSGGFTGVDVFFVLSGFLITSNIQQGLADGSFSLIEFYLRRIQRLLPNIIVMILTTLLLWSLLLPPSMARQTGRHGLYVILNLSNIYIWKNLGGYWGDSAEWSPLTHTWSLAIEEQFYLFYPVFLLLLMRVQPRRVSFWLLCSVFVSFGICLYGSTHSPIATFYLLPTRVWELLMGAVLATRMNALRNEGRPLPFSPGANQMEAIGWVGMMMILFGFLAIDERRNFPGFVALLPTVGTTFLVGSVAAAETKLARLLSSPFMVRTGKLSYSLYLWHWPLITLGKNQSNHFRKPELYGALAGGLLSILFGWAVFLGIEQPLRKRGAGRSWRLAVIAAGFSAVFFYESKADWTESPESLLL